MNCCKASAKLLSGFLFLSLVSGYGQTVGQEYVLNGEFGSAGVANLTNWTTSPTAPFPQIGFAPLPPSGNYALFTTTGGLSQDLLNIPAGRYSFSYYYEPSISFGESLTFQSSIGSSGASQTFTTNSTVYQQFTETVSLPSQSSSLPLSFNVTAVSGGFPAMKLAMVSFTYQGLITPDSSSGGLTAALSANSQAQGWTLVNNVTTATLGTQIAQGASGGTSGGSSGGDSGQESVTIDALTTEYNSLNAEFSTNVMKQSPTSSCELASSCTGPMPSDGCDAKDTPGEVSLSAFKSFSPKMERFITRYKDFKKQETSNKTGTYDSQFSQFDFLISKYTELKNTGDNASVGDSINLKQQSIEEANTGQCTGNPPDYSGYKFVASFNNGFQLTFNALSKASSSVGSLMSYSMSEDFSDDHLHSSENVKLHSEKTLDQVKALQKELAKEISTRNQRISSVASLLGLSYDETFMFDEVLLDSLVVDANFEHLAKSNVVKNNVSRKDLISDKTFFVLSSKKLKSVETQVSKLLKTTQEQEHLYQQTLSEKDLSANAVDLFEEDALVASADDLEFLIENEENSGLVAVSFKSKIGNVKSVIRGKLSKALKHLGNAKVDLEKCLKIVTQLKADVDEGIAKIDAILPHIYKISGEDVALLDVDLEQELALLQSIDEENLIAAKDAVPIRQVASGADTRDSMSKNTHVWGRALGQYIHQNKSHGNPAFSSGSGGALVGADWSVKKHAVGLAGSYMYSYVGQSHHAGHTNVNQGCLAPYAVLRPDYWSIDLSLLGGYSYNNNHRHHKDSSTQYNATSNSHAWQLAPHFGVTYSGIYKYSWFNVEPYLMADYVANWQSSYKEHGAGIFNVSQKSSFSGFIRTESGLNFSEKIAIRYGQLILREKGAWAYQRSLSSSTNTMSLVGLAESFAVPSNASIQNLGVVEFAMTFVPKKTYLPTVEVTYEGQYGSVFMSQLGAINLSKDF